MAVYVRYKSLYSSLSFSAQQQRDACGLGLIPAGRYIWVEFVVSSRLVPKVFNISGFSGSPPSTKPTSPNVNSTRREDPYDNQPRLMWLPSLNIVILITFNIFPAKTE